MVSEGYPRTFSANNSKSELIACGLQELGCRVAICDSILGAKGYHSVIRGTSETGIDYCIIPRRGKYRAILYAIPQVWWYLKKRRRKDDVNHLIMGLSRYPFFFVVWAMAMLLGYRRSVLYHEWHCSSYSFGFKYMEAYLRDNTFGYFVNTVFPISHFLEKKCSHFHCKKMVLPIMGSYNREPAHCEERRYFTYCCGAPYLLRNTIILDAFNKLYHDIKYRHIKLVLIISGNEQEQEDARQLIAQYDMKMNVEVKSQISFDELFFYYDTSIGLLVPMNPDSTQDKARFSQKIAEYISSRRPIITSAVGEIPYYFEQKKSAMIVPYSVEGYYNAMKDLIDDNHMADDIGMGGYQVGLTCFNYIDVSRKMLNYL